MRDVRRSVRVGRDSAASFPDEAERSWRVLLGRGGRQLWRMRRPCQTALRQPKNIGVRVREESVSALVHRFCQCVSSRVLLFH